MAPSGGSGFKVILESLDILFNNDTMYINRVAAVNGFSLNPDPLNPVVFSGYAASDTFNRARIENDMLYLIDKWNFEIYDVTDPTVFAFQDNVAIPNNGVDIPNQLDVEGLFAFTSASPLIQSFNVRPAAIPAYVVQVSDTEFEYSFDLMEDNGSLYEADCGRGIRIYDLY